MIRWKIYKNTPVGEVKQWRSERMDVQKLLNRLKKENRPLFKNIWLTESESDKKMFVTV